MLLLILGAGVVLMVLMQKGFLGKVLGLGGAVADAGTAAVKTIRNVGANIDPFNPKGKAAAVLRAVDPSKPVKALGRAVDPSKLAKPLKSVGKAVSKGVKKLKFW